MSKARPKTGEEREVNRTLKIDLLPQTVKDAIQTLRDQGEPWPQIEARSAKPYSANWSQDGGGFVDWDALDTRVLEEFPDLRLPKSSLHRWYDLRIDQVRSQTLIESERARAWAQEFASKALPEANAAVINALRDQVFMLMRGVGRGDQAMFIEGLKDLTLAMTRMQRVELQAKRVAVDERKVAQLEKDAELKRKQFTKEMDDAERKITRGEALTAEDINRIRERVFGIGPAPVRAAD